MLQASALLVVSVWDVHNTVQTSEGIIVYISCTPYSSIHDDLLLSQRISNVSIRISVVASLERASTATTSTVTSLL